MTTVSKDIVHAGARLIQDEVQSSFKKKMPLQSAISLSAKVLGLKSAHHASSSPSDQGSWLVVGRYAESDMVFVDEIACSLAPSGLDAILSSARSRYSAEDGDEEAPLYQVAIHSKTGERHFASPDNLTEVSAEDLVHQHPGPKRSTVCETAVALQDAFVTVDLEELQEIVSTDKLVLAMTAQEAKQGGRRVGAGALAELAVEFVHNEIGGRLIDFGCNHRSSIQDQIDVDVLSNAIRRFDGGSSKDKLEVADFILSDIRKTLQESKNFAVIAEDVRDSMASSSNSK